MNDELRQEIESTVRRILFPTPLIHWMEGLTGAERNGRIARSKLSVLRYGIQRYVQSQLPEIDQRFRLDVEPYDDSIRIAGRDPVTPVDNWEITVAYPIWLQEFLDDDDRFALMVPGCTDKLEEVLQRVFEWCREHEDYRVLVG
jgi:hypothetical protein